ncbi:MAG: NADH-quinone oxidoreductase subunit M [Thermoleophilaceae bacterium]
MTIHLSILVFLTAGRGPGGSFPARAARALAGGGRHGGGARLRGGRALLHFDSAKAGQQAVTDQNWISELGIRYHLGLDGLNLFMVVMTALLWVPSAIWGAVRTSERPRLFMFHLALAETAVLGAFCAQDLALFVVFFDLMLVPFYFLIGGWGQGDRVRATTKFVIFTLVGSLLMLAGAVALGVLSTPDGGSISFSFADLQQNTLATGTQEWIFLLFAIAFVVKAPLFPFHGWVVDTYRATPTPVLVLLSARAGSKVGVYGFLRIVLPILPDAAQHFQDLMLALAAFSILYGSVLAFSQAEPRLVVAYSSIAQLGFITLGIFSLDDKGAQGALMQMVNHALVTAALFFIIAALTARAGGSPTLVRMGAWPAGGPCWPPCSWWWRWPPWPCPARPTSSGEILILFGTLRGQARLRPGGHRGRGARRGLHDPRVPALHAQPRRAGRAP